MDHSQETLPSYLHYPSTAPAPEAQTVAAGDVRVTVLSPCLLRIEQGSFTDEATQLAVNRKGIPTQFRWASGETLVVETEQLELRWTVGRPISAETLSIRRKTSPCFTWRFGDRPLQNLGGTATTLDGASGAIPIGDGLCSLDGYALVDDSGTPVFREDGWFRGRPAGLDLYFFGHGHDYTEAIRDYYRLSGAPAMLPAFALGNWWSRYYKYTEESYLSLMDRFRSEDIPLSTAIIDMDWHLTDGDGRDYWHDGWTGYTWNPKFFPDHRRFLKGLHDRNLRTALNLHPASGVRSWETQYESMAKAMGIDPETKAPVPCNTLSPKYWKEYFEQLHFPYERDGVDFWWIDWQQGTDYEKIAGPGSYEKALSSVTPLWLMNHMHYLASARNGKRGFLFSRFGGFGSQRYPIGFSGDSYINWESLDFQPYFTVTASNIGYGWWSHDIGGHMHGYKDDELAARWVQFGVFSPIFRLHSSNHPFTGREPWNYNKRAELVIADFMRLRHRLFPYLYTMNHRCHAELLPLMRPMYHVDPEVKEAYGTPNEYWFGSELVVSPITRKADPASDLGEAQVWLSEGIWVDPMNGFVYRGGMTRRVFRPLEQMPLFLRAGGILPMQAHLAGENRLGRAEQMEVLLAPGGSNRFTLFEDDGESLAESAERCVTTELALQWAETRAVFTVSAARGDLSLIPEGRSWKLVFTGWRRGCRFELDGQSLEAAYDSRHNRYTLTVPARSVREEITVTVTNTDGLLHDNSDRYDRAMELLIHAQMDHEIKLAILQRLEEALSRNKQMYPHDLWNGHINSTLSAAIFELYQDFMA